MKRTNAAVAALAFGLALVVASAGAQKPASVEIEVGGPIRVDGREIIPEGTMTTIFIGVSTVSDDPQGPAPPPNPPFPADLILDLGSALDDFALNGSEIETWLDSSGAGIDFGQPAAAKRPALLTVSPGVNVASLQTGFPLINTDQLGATPHAISSALDGAGGWTAFFHSTAAGATSDPQAIYFLVAFVGDNGGDQMGIGLSFQRNAGPSNQLAVRTGPDASGVLLATSDAMPDTGRALFAVSVDFAAGTVDFRRNGSALGGASGLTFAATTWDAGTPSTTRDSIGPANAAGGSAVFGPLDLGPLLLYKRAMTPAEMATVEAYLAE